MSSILSLIIKDEDFNIIFIYIALKKIRNCNLTLSDTFNNNNNNKNNIDIIIALFNITRRMKNKLKYYY